MDFKNLFLSAQGRINRQPYIIGVIIIFVIEVVINVAAEATQIPALMILYVIPLWMSIMAGIKRCHDRGRSGWFLLIALIPLVNIWLVVELIFLPGTDGSNDYGENPLVKT